LVKFRKVSDSVWVSFEAVVIENDINKRNELIKIIFTIITTSIVHNLLTGVVGKK
jgi:hypothetical protein